MTDKDKIIQKALLEDLKKDIEAAEQLPDVEISPEFEDRMKKLLKSPVRSKKTSSVIFRAAAAAAVFLLAAGTALATVMIYSEKPLEPYDQSSGIVISLDSETDIFDDRLIITAALEDYELIDKSFDNFKCTLYKKRDLSKAMFFCECSRSDLDILFFDNEDEWQKKFGGVRGEPLYEIIDEEFLPFSIDGAEVTFGCSNVYKDLTFEWDKNDTHYILDTRNLDYEEALNMLRSISAKK